MKLPYGLSDFRSLREQGYVYIDKTPYIERLERLPGKYLFFVRPRRFGKSLFLSMLAHYYDVNADSNFASLYGDLYIGQHPTELKNSYLVLELDFSGLRRGSKEQLESSFITKLRGNIVAFIDKYDRFFQGASLLKEELNRRADAAGMLDLLIHELKKLERKLYLVIDEYDHFANDIIAVGNGQFYKEIIRGAGFVRDFYETVKIGTKSVIDRIFITGISPIMLDDMTSGFNISTNLTTHIVTNEMLGFTESEVRQIVRNSGVQTDEEALVGELRKNYNGYLFNEDGKNRLYNSDMVLYFFNEWLTGGKYPKQLIDDNVRTDYGKLRRLMASDRNRRQLEKIIADEGIVTNLVSKFSFDRMYDEEYFVSLLFYMGLLTITGTKYGMTELGVPNYVIKQIFWEHFERELRETAGIEYAGAELGSAVWEMAYAGKVQPLADFLNRRVLKALSNRDLIRFDEKAFKVLLLAYLSMTSLYRPVSEREEEGRYVDILLEKDFRVQGDLQEWLLELKDVKTGERSNLEQKIAEAIREGREQLERYAQSPGLAGKAGRLKQAVLVLVGRDEVRVADSASARWN